MQNSDTRQTIRIYERKQIEIECVEGILVLDEDGAVLDTTVGTIAVEGASLRIENFDKQTKSVCLVGEISGVYYIEKRNKRKGRNSK